MTHAQITTPRFDDSSPALLCEQSGEWSLDGELAEDLPAGEKQPQRACEHKQPPIAPVVATPTSAR